jgi:hypothetical protein
MGGIAGRGRSSKLWFYALYVLLAACGGDSGGNPPPPVVDPPPPPPPPPPDPLTQQVIEARDEILADSCFRQQGANCAWTERAYSSAEFAMTQSTGEAIMVIDEFPTLPVSAIRYKNRIKGFYRFGAGGLVTPAMSKWRVPSTLWNVLTRFAAADHIPAQRLSALSPAIATSYQGVQFDTAGHGSYVFSVLADTNPLQPLVLVDGLDLARMTPDDYCDTSGAADVQTRLNQIASAAADQIAQTMRANEVRFVNYSAGHTLATVAADWEKSCGSTAPPESVLRAKLAAYAPIYTALFKTPGVIVAHAAIGSGNAADAPYDQASADYPNRLRIGYFTSLNSGLDVEGRGNYGVLQGWPGGEQVDLYLNTGVLPMRPFEYNRTPLLQLDGFGVDLFPVTAPQTSWVAPLALSRFINIRYNDFAGRQMSDPLIAEIFNAAVPALCADLPGQRCRYQDPLLHGKVEAVRLLYRPQYYR